MKFDPQKHHRRSIRLKEYDYSQQGWYFITLCTKDRKRLFGKVVDSNIKLNEWGKIAEKEWLKTAEIRKNIIIDRYIIMPNHLHGIIGIVDGEAGYSKGTMHRAPTVLAPPKEQFGKPTTNSIPTIIRSYKAVITKTINSRRNTPGSPVWQKNYYERVIRNEPEINRIRKYIIENPAKWQDDKYY